MSNRKEVLNLLSQAKQHLLRAEELESKAKELHYKDVLEQCGLKHGSVVRLKDCAAKIIGMKYWGSAKSGLSGMTWLNAAKLKKDGSVSAYTTTIYSKNEILEIIKE